MTGKTAAKSSQRGKQRGRRAGQKAKKPSHSGFKTYIYRVLKKLDGKGDMGISKKTMSILNLFLLDLFGKVAREAGSICKYSKRHTLGARDVQAAVSLLLPGELRLHAVSEGTSAAKSYAAKRS